MNDTDNPVDSITDWFLPTTDYLDGFIYPNHTMIREHPFLHPMAEGLLKRCRLAMEQNGGYLDFRIQEGHRRYRVHLIRNVGAGSGPNEGTFALRRMPASVPHLHDLGLPKVVVEVMLHPKLNHGGLVIICGETGQGKSTTCASMIRERMLVHGTFTLTIEDPVEAALEGAHANGHCLQTEVVGGNFADALKGAMRSYPVVPGSMLYVGETRDRETAHQVLQIATNGHLVLTTIHANGPIEALQRLLAMAEGMMSRNEAADVVASTVRMIAHQNLKRLPAAPGQPARRKPEIRFLLSSRSNSSVATVIRDGRLQALENEMATQERRSTMMGVDEVFK